MDYLPAKTIISGYAEKNPWFGCNYNMNLYKGCCHGCIYCDSRSLCYQIDDFDHVRAKENALVLVERELRGKRRTGVIGTGAMSDPYNPFEKELCLTGGALKLIDRYGFGVAIATKGSLIARDVPVLASIATHSPVLCKMTVTTCDDKLARIIEPAAPPPSERMAAVAALAKAGLYVGLLLMPVLPFVTDSEENIRGIVTMAAESGARFIYPAFGMTNRTGQREYYYKKLEQSFPGLKERYEQLYGDRYECGSPRAKALKALFEETCKQSGIRWHMRDIIREYKENREEIQLSLF